MGKTRRRDGWDDNFSKVDRLKKRRDRKKHKMRDKEMIDNTKDNNEEDTNRYLDKSTYSRLQFSNVGLGNV